MLSLVVHLVLFASAVAETCKEWVAKVVSAQGSVEVQRQGETQWQPVRLHDTYCPGDKIRIQEHSRAAIVLRNDALLRLDQNTTITFNGLEQERTFLLTLLRGVVYFFSRIPRGLNVITPFVNAAVEGTEFVVTVEPEQTLLSVFNGRVVATNQAGSLALVSGQSAFARVAQAPELRMVVRPRDAVQWALYYPPILDVQPSDFPGDTAWQAMIRQSIQFYRAGDVRLAFERMADLPEDIRDPRLFTYRAALWLTVGRVHEARQALAQALRLDPHNSQAVALQSVIAVVHNQKADALALARQAIALQPESSVAWVALSYAQQAHFDLRGALTSLQEAVRLAPDHALAWARLAELWLSLGYLGKALGAARQATTLHPNLARTQTVLGFVFLTQVKLRDAYHAFTKAIPLDEAAPLPRLGLGLVKIRQGDLQEGRADIEIAISLDPDNALLRSYLGKAYYEERRDQLARDQLAMAKGLDRLDPTAFFYDAIRQQSVNRPVEALQDLQKAIELNDNRAVYRSRLLLDDDLAARSATLGRLYNELGFQQRALVEGWHSLSVDPSNYSAHRFLADSYTALPRHEIARVSELLQSQLLQPLNIAPVQPQLAESELFVVSDTGPSIPSLNEFHPLFNRNRFALLASAVVGNHDTLGDEVVLSGVADRLSYSAGQFHFTTDGFRENNDLEQDIVNLFLQAELSHHTSVQAEFRYTDTDRGDRRRFFDPAFFSSTLREQVRTESIRLGARYGVAPHSDVIASVIYRDIDGDLQVSPGVSIAVDEDGYLAEMQHLFRSQRLHVTTGVGYLTTERQETLNLFPIPPQVTQNDVQHTNVYTYVQFNVLRNLTLTLGGSADFFDDADIDRMQFNPKLGVIWNLFPSTTVRAAVFRVLKRTLLSSQTIEPTQVAGFNQFFDDIDSTDAWRYGIAIDQKFSPYLYAGAEFSARDVSDVPIIVAQPVRRVERLERDERLARAYVYWTPHTWLALQAEYLYEDLEFDAEARNALNTAEVRTHRVSSGLGFFHPSGFRARLRATYIDQEGTFRDATGGIVPGADQFWVVDAAIGYRLPKRWGLLTVELRNLFDQGFSFQDTDLASPTVSPERLIVARFTLAY